MGQGADKIEHYKIHAVDAGVADPHERAAIRDSLLAYCRLDTLAMVKIWGKLCETSGDDITEPNEQ